MLAITKITLNWLAPPRNELGIWATAIWGWIPWISEHSLLQLRYCPVWMAEISPHLYQPARVVVFFLFKSRTPFRSAMNYMTTSIKKEQERDATPWLSLTPRIHCPTTGHHCLHILLNDSLTHICSYPLRPINNPHTFLGLGYGTPFSPDGSCTLFSSLNTV